MFTLTNSCKKDDTTITPQTGDGGITSVVFNNANTYGTMTDQNGNIYKTITIGTQTWMAENLRVTKYRNGDPIPNVTDNAAWAALTTGAYCSYANTTDKDKIATYGLLYNWFTVTDSRNIAPAGWHVPTNDEWETLTTFLGGAGAGGQMKETGTTHWLSPNTGATNESGFSGTPAGARSHDGDGMFKLLGKEVLYLSKTEFEFSYAKNRGLNFWDDECNTWADYKQTGCAVRLLKD